MRIEVDDLIDWFNLHQGDFEQELLFNILQENDALTGNHTLMGAGCRLHVFEGNAHDPDKDTPALRIDTDDLELSVFYYHGARHRVCEPALIRKTPDEFSEAYFELGLNHREDGPAIRVIGSVEYFYRYYIQGIPHREDGPATLSILEGECVYLDYFINGVNHREVGPAHYEDTGSDRTMEYYRYGQLHREDGPAKIYHNLKDQTSTIEYYIGGEHHREDGPAKIVQKIGSMEEECYLSGEKKSSVVNDILKIKKKKEET